MTPTSPTTTILDEVTTWAGITTQPTPRGATAIMFDGHELGHVHPDRGTLDLPLAADRRAQVLEAGRAKKWFSNWVTKDLTSHADAEDGITLLRDSYDTLRVPVGRK
jgi:luciferase-like monooxygenase